MSQPGEMNHSPCMFTVQCLMVQKIQNCIFSCRLVTPTSKCLLRFYSHSLLKRDLVLGEGRIDIHKQLVREQGKFDKTNLVVDIKVRNALNITLKISVLISCMYL